MKYIKIKVIAIGLQLVFSGNGISHAQLSDKREKIHNFIRSKLAKSSLSGLAVAVVQRDSVLLSKGYGKTASGESVTADTPFAFASLSKAFTALAVMQLAAAGQLDLDSPVVNYLSSFRLTYIHQGIGRPDFLER